MRWEKGEEDEEGGTREPESEWARGPAIVGC